jgi:hypothetical protein
MISTEVDFFKLWPLEEQNFKDGTGTIRIYIAVSETELHYIFVLT